MAIGELLPWIIAVAVMGIGGTFVYLWFFGWKVNVTIFERRRNGMRVVKDKAKRVKDKDTNTSQYRLRKAKEAIQPQQLGDIVQDTKGRDQLYLLKDMDGVYKPVEFSLVGNPGNMEVTARDDDWKNWVLMQSRLSDVLFHKPNFFEKYGSVLNFTVVAIGMGIMAYIFFIGIGDASAQMSGAAGAFREAADVIREAIIISRGGNIATTV